MFRPARFCRRGTPSSPSSRRSLAAWRRFGPGGRGLLRLLLGFVSFGCKGGVLLGNLQIVSFGHRPKND